MQKYGIISKPIMQKGEPTDKKHYINHFEEHILGCNATRPLSRCYIRSYLVKTLQELTNSRARYTTKHELNMSITRV